MIFFHYGIGYLHVVAVTISLTDPSSCTISGHGWHAAEETQDYGHDSPVSFEGDHGYEAAASAGGAEYEATGGGGYGGGSEHGY